MGSLKGGHCKKKSAKFCNFSQNFRTLSWRKNRRESSGGMEIMEWPGHGIAFFRALNFQISEPEIWQKSLFLRKFQGFSWKFRPLKNIFQTLENGHSIRHQSIPPLSAGRKNVLAKCRELSAKYPQTFPKKTFANDPISELLRFVGRGCNEALFSKRSVSQWKGGRLSINEGFGKDVYKKGNGITVKRSGPFSEPPDSETWKAAVLIPFPKISSCFCGMPRLVALCGWEFNRGRGRGWESRPLSRFCFALVLKGF